MIYKLFKTLKNIFLFSTQRDYEKKGMDSSSKSEKEKNTNINILILGKEHFGKSYLLENLFSKGFINLFFKGNLKKKITFNKNIISDIYHLSGNDTLNEWRIKAKVLCLLKEKDFKCEECLKTPLDKDKCLLENLKEKIIFLDDIDLIKSGKKFKLLKEILKNSKFFIATSKSFNFPKSLKLLLKEKETLVYEIEKPYFLENKFYIRYKGKLDKSFYKEKEEKKKIISLLFYILVGILLLFGKVYLLVVVYIAFRYRERIIRKIDREI